MPPNCVRDPTQDCIGYAEAQILRHQIEVLTKQQEALTKQQDEYQESNKKDHKEFFNRLEFGEKAQALTQQQLAQILTDTSEIKSDLKERAKDLTTAIEGKNKTIDEKIQKHEQAIHDLQMEPAKKWKFLSNETFKLVIAFVFGVVVVALGWGAFR